jgi:XRE family transcriptional regulator, regulator of sulfur utilization
MKLNDRLRELRKERSLTLRELQDFIEERTGEKLSISYLSELERKEAMPSVETLARVAGGYGISLQDLLAPVDFYEVDSVAGYPKGLLKFKEKRQIEDDWVDTLARIEFRGQRPETDDEWLAVYSMLKAFIEPKLKKRPSKS